eukprot:2236328-Prymnesium_polylepis.1
MGGCDRVNTQKRGTRTHAAHGTGTSAAGTGEVNTGRETDGTWDNGRRCTFGWGGSCVVADGRCCRQRRYR